MLQKAKHLTTTKNPPFESNNENLWIKFTYFGNDIKIITKMFKNSVVRAAYNVEYTIKIRCKTKIHHDKQEQQSYQLNA